MEYTKLKAKEMQVQWYDAITADPGFIHSENAQANNASLNTIAFPFLFLPKPNEVLLRDHQRLISPYEPHKYGIHSASVAANVIGLTALAIRSMTV
jgi:hypothetical protein